MSLLNDDEPYRRVATVAKNAEAIASNANKVVQQAHETLDSLQSKNGPVQGLAANVKQTMGDARVAMAGFAENMQALKHNFLFSGFFNKRGHFNMTNIAPADYRRGVLANDKNRRVLRVWLISPVIFGPGRAADRRTRSAS